MRRIEFPLGWLEIGAHKLRKSGRFLTINEICMHSLFDICRISQNTLLFVEIQHDWINAQILYSYKHDTFGNPFDILQIIKAVLHENN